MTLPANQRLLTEADLGEVQELRTQIGSGLSVTDGTMAAIAADPESAFSIQQTAKIGGPLTGSAYSVLQADLPMRDFKPVVVAFAGCSHSLGASASLADTQFPDRVAQRARTAYPSVGDDAVPLMRTLTGATTASPLQPGLQFVNASVGSTTAETFLTDATSDDLMALEPSLIIMDAGFSNSRANGVPVATAKAQLEARIAYLKSAATAPFGVVLLHVHDRSTGDQTQEWALFGQAMIQIAIADPATVSFLDGSVPFRLADSTAADPFGLMAPDGTHLNNRGHEVLADLIAAHVFTVAKSPELAPVDRVLWAERITSDTFSGGDTTTLSGRTTDAALGGTSATWGSAGGASAIQITGGKLTRNTSPSSQTIRLDCAVADVRLGVKVEAAGATPLYIGVRMSHTTITAGSTGYVADFAWDISGEPTGVVALKKIVNGERSTLAAPVRFQLGSTVEVEACGPLIGIRIDGRLVRQAVDYTVAGGSYAILGVYSTATFTLDNVTLERIGDRAPTRNYARTRYTSDAFTGGDALTLDGRTTDATLGGTGQAWATSPGATQHIGIVSGRLARGTTGSPVAAVDGADANCAASIRLDALPTGSGFVALFARRSVLASATASQYRVKVLGTGVACIERTNASTIGIRMSPDVPVRAGDRIEIACFDTTIDLIVNGVVAASAIDSNVTAAGRCGLEMQAATTTFSLDDFTIDNLS